MSQVGLHLKKGEFESDWALASVILSSTVSWLNALGAPLWTHTQVSAPFLQEQYGPDAMYLLVHDGQAVGVVFLLFEDPDFWPEVTSPDSLFLHKLAIHPTQRGRGHGSAALEAITNHARDLGMAWVRLDCDDREPLRRFYEANGFQLVDRKAKDGYHVVRYAKPLMESPSA